MKKNTPRGLLWVLLLIGAFPVTPLLCEEEPSEPGNGEPEASAPPEAGEVPNTDQQIAAEIQRYWSLLNKYPGDASIHVNLGNLYAMWGWKTQALEEYHRAIRLNPEDSIAWTNLGALYESLGNSSKSVRAFRKAIRLNPNSALAHYNLGTLLQERGKYDRAIEHYKRAVDLNPSLASLEENPQVVHNPSLTVVLLEKYQERSGRLTLPLQWVPLPENENPDSP